MTFLTWRADWTWRQVLRNPPLVHAEEMHDVDDVVSILRFPRSSGGVCEPNQCCSQPGSAPEDVAAGQARLVQGQGIVSVVRKSPRKLLVAYTVSGNGEARIGLVYSPLWKIKRTGETSNYAIVSSSADGLVEVPLDPGRHELELVFDVGWPERCGKIISMLSVVIFIGGVLAKLVYSKFGQQKLHFSGL